MKKYYYEAKKLLLDRPTEPNYLFCAPARTWVIAENEEQALELARKSLVQEYHGSGIALNEPYLTKVVDLPVDWNYGYGDDRHPNPTEDLAVLTAEFVIR